jgi:non-specific serine/threonine protein kinase/serine/threonine-protein kinase
MPTKERDQAHPQPNNPDELSGQADAPARNVEGREEPIERIGPYRGLKKAGEDAVALVYQAEQEEPVRLKVALKVIKEGLDWGQVTARLESERDTLSMLDHPNIGKVLGTGTRQSGQPYFVLEWIEGVPITTYCDEHRLPLKQRLELFITVCEAVQYACRKGILHGNLKPSNVLVISQGDKPSPKVLDLAVAWVMRQKPAQRDTSAGLAGLGDRSEYLSPEQADANVQDIDSRSDVYSLGVLLYELLTGTTPLPQERLKNVSIREALRLIREEETPTPSARLEESKDELAQAAAKRQMKPDALVKAVHGELDCVLTKALQKDRERRYETAGELKRDVQRYQASELVEACPPSTRNQLWYVARKHPRVLVTGSIIALVLLAVAVAAASMAGWEWRKAGQARKAEQEAVQKRKKAEETEETTRGKLRLSEAAQKTTAKEREKAQEAAKEARRSEQETRSVLAFLNDKLLSAGRPAGTSIADAFWAAGQNKDITLRKAVDTVEPQVAGAFADRPLAEAAIREMLGMAYLNVGEPDKAVKQYERAFALREAMQGISDPDTADCRNKLAVAYRLAGRTTEAARLFDQNPNSPTHAAALALQGGLLLTQKKPAEAELKLRASLTIRQKIQPDEWTTFDTKSMLGEALLEQKKYDEAESLLLSGYEGLKKREADIPVQKKSPITQALERLVRLYRAWNKEDKAAQWQKELETNKVSK